MSMRSPTSRPVVVAGSDDATVRVWDLDARGPLYQPLQGHKGKVNAVAVGDVHGRPIAISGSDDRTVQAWDLEAGRPLGGPLAGHDGWVLAVAVGELSGRPIAVSGGLDDTVRVWTWRRAGRLGSRWCMTASSTRWRSASSTTARVPLLVMAGRRCGQSWQRRSPTRAGKLR